jgi:hypothetical protein
MPLDVLLYGLTALMWLHLMHTRSLPLEGLRGIWNLVMALWYYALVAVPVWGVLHGQVRYSGTGPFASAEVVLVAWVIGFVSAMVTTTNEYTARSSITAGVGLCFIMIYQEWTWLPWFEAAFGVVAWDVLLHF